VELINLDEDGASLAELINHVLVMDNLLAHVNRRAVEIRAIFTTSIARTTPAQKPLVSTSNLFLCGPGSRDRLMA
jgi:hypothetical protein